jgi:cysteinyl-tRNA synthetase
MAFSLVRWQNVLELSEDLFESSRALLSRIGNFLGLAEGLRGSASASNIAGYSEADGRFAGLLAAVQSRVREAFANNFDVPAALNAIRELIDGASVTPAPNNGLIVAGARFVRRITDVLGFGFETVGLSAGGGGLGPIAKELAEYRQSARANARALLADARAVLKKLGVDPKAQRPEDPGEQEKWELAGRLLAEVQAVLGGLDGLRDDALPAIGIRLEDQGDGSVTFKVGEPEAPRVKPPPKAPKQPAAHREVVAHPSEHFKAQTEKYSEWDESGLPTKTADGKELSKGQVKKVKKEYEGLLTKWKKAHPDE